MYARGKARLGQADYRPAAVSLLIPVDTPLSGVHQPEERNETENTTEKKKNMKKRKEIDPDTGGTLGTWMTIYERVSVECEGKNSQNLKSGP